MTSREPVENKGSKRRNNCTLECCLKWTSCICNNWTAGLTAARYLVYLEHNNWRRGCQLKERVPLGEHPFSASVTLAMAGLHGIVSPFDGNQEDWVEYA